MARASSLHRAAFPDLPHAAEYGKMWLDHYRLERGKAIRVFKDLPPEEVKV